MSEQTDSLATLERAITRADFGEARKALRAWFSQQYADPTNANTVGDWLRLFADTHDAHPAVTAVAIRCSAVPGLLTPNSTNQIERSIVALAFRSLPELASYLDLDSSDQTYVNYQRLTSVHDQSLALLEPMTRSYGDLDAIVEGRRDLLGALRHGSFRSYFTPFGLDQVRSDLESIFGPLSRLIRHPDSLLDDLDDCREASRAAREHIDDFPSFLAYNVLGTFLSTLEDTMRPYLNRMQGAFAANITLALEGETLTKRYPLHEVGRRLRIAIPMSNLGPGRATDVRVSCADSDDNITMEATTLHIGNVSAGDFEVIFDCCIERPCRELNFILQVEWGQINSIGRQSGTFLVQALSQDSEIDWPSLEYSSPYSTEVAEGDDFVGRVDRVKELAGKILRTPMEPFYITGQRRVGKTSLAMAAAKCAASNAQDFDVIVHYVLWGTVADISPTRCLERLGRSIDEEISSRLPSALGSGDRNYNGSLGDLLTLARLAEQLEPKKRFLIILDEIDEMPSALYASGELAATFFNNLRALSRANNIGLVLVGGENLPYIMDRQGQRLNNFSRINLNSFDRGSEWVDFRLLVQAPSSRVLNWHEEAVSEVYDVTAGNPYFAKLVCRGVFRKAVAERDADVTGREVSAGVERELSTLGANFFAHLWRDGIPYPEDRRDPMIVERQRLLLAMARCLRRNQPLTLDTIRDNQPTSGLANVDVEARIGEFCRRGIMLEREERYDLALPIFARWLTDVGVAQLASDGLGEELARATVEEERKHRVTSAEVAELVEGWPTYRGRRIASDEVRAWFEQVEGVREQRILFDLLKRVRVYSEVMVRERLKTVYEMLRSTLPQYTITRRAVSRSDVLITYGDGPGKSGAYYASLFAEENRIPASCVVAPEALEKRFGERVDTREEVKAVILIDDIAGTGGTLEKALNRFVDEHRALLEKTMLRIAVLVATQEGEERVKKKVQQFDGLDIECRAGEILVDAQRAFPKDGGGWSTEAQRGQAEALFRDLGGRVYRRSPLGVGGQGLLVVFPSTVPNNCLPILHTANKRREDAWRPLFPRPVN